MALPFLNSMGWAKQAKELPKRMLVSYFSYGAYMPNGTAGIPSQSKPHHDWSWWPCRDAGPLSFNQSSKPFEPLKNYVSYYQGLDHAGGWSLGGHSSGDVFATGADMVGTEKTNNISLIRLQPIPMDIKPVTHLLFWGRRRYRFLWKIKDFISSRAWSAYPFDE